MKPSAGRPPGRCCWPTAATWLLLAMLVTAAAAPHTTGEDWNRYRGPRLTGISAETQWRHDWPRGGPKIAWTAAVGTGLSSLVISSSRVYTMGNADDVDTVYCLNADTGEPVWTHAYPSPTDPNEFDGGPTSTPTVDGDRVFTISRRGDVFALDKATGQVLWTQNVADDAGVRFPAWGFAGSPLALGDRLILNVGDAGVALDKSSGELLWKSADKEAGYSTPVPYAAGDDLAVILGSSRSYVSVDPKSGREQWRVRWLTTFGCNAADPIVDGHHVFLSSGYNRGSALYDVTGDEPRVVWKHKEFQNHMSTSVLIDGHLYGAHGDVAKGAPLVCVEWMTGAKRWSADQLRVGGLAAAGDRMIVLEESGRLVIAAAKPQGFELLAAHQVLEGTCWTAPVLCGGRIHCRAADGHVVCVDVR